MPVTHSRLGYVLVHIYDFSFAATIYLPDVVRYEADTECLVCLYEGGESIDPHQQCLKSGFTNWLGVAVVSDTCDEVSEPTESNLIAAFNDDCKAGGWLHKMMNYWNTGASSP